LTREQRRLAADVVGYSRLMERDESGTVARLREHRKLHLEPVLARHGGRLVKLIRDGALVEFASAVEALGAAIEFQQVMAEANRDQPQDNAIVFRIGLHLGDLIVDGDDLYGDGVNVAARLEAEAPPGGIVISGDVHNAVAGRLEAAFVALGKSCRLRTSSGRCAPSPIPDPFRGAVGHKPIHRLVPYTGAFPIELTLDHTRPVARTAGGAARLLEVLAGADGTAYEAYAKQLTGDKCLDHPKHALQNEKSPSSLGK
jgi:hypothetical protein